MPNTIIPIYTEEFGVIYIETEDKTIKTAKKKATADDDGTVRVSDRDEKLAEQGAQKFEKAFSLVSYVAQKFVKSMDSLQADELELEIGMSFNGEFSLPYIAKASTEANFKVTVKWQKPKENIPV